MNNGIYIGRVQDAPGIGAEEIRAAVKRNAQYEVRKMSEEDLRKEMYWICCPMCDNDKCMKGTSGCEAEQWLQRKVKEYAD